MLIRMTTGKENFPDCSAACYVFVVPSQLFPGAKELHLNQAVRDDSRGVNRHGPSQRFPAAPGMREETGFWVESTYDVQPGSVLKVFGQRKGSHRTGSVSASQYLRVREGAPLVRLTSTTTNHRWAQGRNGVSVEGRFDLVTPDQAREQGARINRNFTHQSHQSIIETIFTVRILEPEVAAAPVTETVEVAVDGSVARVTRRRRRRALNFGD